jgi:lipoprotein-releasing system ATP-binding protein
MLLSASELHKTYRLGRVSVPVLRGASLDVGAGEWVAVLGSSGSGKSTLLHLLGGLDRPDARREGPRPAIVFEGKPLAEMSPRELDRHRALAVGFVFQFYHLLPELNVIENVLAPAMVARGRFGYRRARRDLRAQAGSLLTELGLAHRLRHRSAELSGGERQRVAIARALINRPRLLLADEPTGNLDQKTGDGVLDSIARLRAERGLTIVMVTHDERVAARADRIVSIRDGRVETGRPSGTP